jgi:hypothetical protein
MITRVEFNNMLNFGALTSAEFALEINGRAIEARDFTTDFVSSQDVVVDYVSARKVAALTRSADSFVIRISRRYPWHEALVEDCVALSVHNRFAVTPTLIFCKNALLAFEHDDETHWFEGDAPHPLPEGSGTHQLIGNHLLALYRRDARIQRDLIARCARRRLASSEGGAQRLSELGPDRFVDLVETMLVDSVTDEISAEEFRQTLLQIWPAGARGRLASYVYLKEGRPGLVARNILWNVNLGDGAPVALGGQQLSGHGEVAQTLARDGVRRMQAFPRSAETDDLVLAGALRYEENSQWDFRGWPVIATSLDPGVIVRTDGLYRWLTIAGDGVQSIERIASGENRSVGGGFIQRHFHAYCREQTALFLGLGLGVVQRAWSDVDITTVECRPAVCEIFERLYQPTERHQIVHGEFLAFLNADDRCWRLVILDFHDPEQTALSDEWLSTILARLAVDGMIVLNRHAATDEFVAVCIDAARRFGLDIEPHALDHQQMVVALRRR